MGKEQSPRFADFQRVLFLNPAKVKTSVLVGKLFSIPALFLLDMLTIYLCLITACYIRNGLYNYYPGFFKAPLLPGTFGNLWWIPMVVFFFMAYENLYQKRLPAWLEVEKILKALTCSIVFAISLIYMTRLANEISRLLVLLVWLIMLILLPLFRYWGKLILSRLKIWTKPVIIIGNGKMADLLVKALSREKAMGYEAIGVLCDEEEGSYGLVDPASGKIIPVLGAIDNAEQVIATYGVQDVIVVAHDTSPKQLIKLTNRLQLLINNVILVPELLGLSMNGIEVQYFFEEQVLILNIKNKLNSVFNQAVKRLFDLCVGSICLLLSLPFMFLIALAIKINTRGPVFFIQERIGRNDIVFKCVKFRTMFLEAGLILDKYLSENSEAREEWQVYQKLRGYDPRLTAVGKILRRFSLDELPQLFNVITGDMSLVGPRPYLPREKLLMNHQQTSIQITRPGLTGLWQVSGRNQIEFDGRLKLDELYVRNWSIWLDITLFLRTFPVLFKREGAY